MGMKSTTGGGEIVQVQGGHIVRSTGRKDRHSKVYTSKGPRDRRVRLSAHTAIQFYDVQDRLGYDRPSKAVDWLIKKAKSAIDKLAELPPWHPTTQEEAPEIQIPEETETESSAFNNFHSGFIPSQIDTDAIAFFPTTSATETMNFPTYPPAIMSRNANPCEDLGLSLHSFQDSGLTANNHVGFVSWNNNSDDGTMFSQRGTLQSSFSGWNDIAMNLNSSSSSEQNHQNKSQGSIFGGRFVSDGMGIHGFCIPARIQGGDDEDNHHHHHHHHGIGGSDHRPSSSASPNSHR